MLSARVYLVLVTTLGAFGLILWFLIGPRPHDSWLRSATGNREHAVHYLPRASMLQAADTCSPSHFGPDETYGWWVQDFQFILQAPRADSVFASLATRPELMARFYGLIGLQLTDPAAFQRAQLGIAAPDTLILVAADCAEPQPRPAAAVLAEIKRGEWGARMVRSAVDVH